MTRPPVSRVVLGARRSELARIQAERVEARLREAWPGLKVERLHVLTEGDRVLDRPLPEIGGKGLFTAELEAAIVAGSIDAAVHSLKDLPTRFEPRLTLLAVPEREDPRDVLVWRPGAGLDDLPPGAVVGTSSLRRRALLLRRRPDCRPRPIRGNVDTRLRKRAAGEYDALVLAAAGLRRLRSEEAPGTPLDPEAWLPAPGQGALAVQGRADDEPMAALFAAIDAEEARAAVAAERAFLARLEGSCRVPIGALAERQGDRIRLRGVVLAPDGSEAVEGVREGPAEEADELGRALAEALLSRGAERILAPLRAGAEDSPDGAPAERA